MNEINFYQIDDVPAKSIAPLLTKILDDKKKAMIFCNDLGLLKEVDEGLWQFGKVRFIPHVTIFEKDIEKISTWVRQPVVISNEEENKNNADYLLLLDEVSSEFAKNFKRIFFFYESQQINKAKAFAKKITANKIKSFKKEDGKWIESSL